MPSGFRATLDKRQQDRLMRRFRPAEIERVLNDAAKAGAKEAAKIMKARAPVGTSDRPSQYYRRNGLPHGTFRATVTTRKIRGRRAALTGIQGRTIGYVIGPIGKNAFTRAWIEYGTSRGERANPWVEQIAGPALDVAEAVSVRELVAYGRG